MKLNIKAKDESVEKKSVAKKAESKKEEMPVKVSSEKKSESKEERKTEVVKDLPKMEAKKVRKEGEYTAKDISVLKGLEPVRLRPGMYIGKLGDGSAPDDGIYVLMKEVIDNCIDEHTMGYGKQVEISIQGKQVTIRDYGRGIPLGKIVDVVSKINTGAKYDSKAFQKSVGLNGVGTKAVNALSEDFEVTAFREGKQRSASFKKACW